MHHKITKKLAKIAKSLEHVFDIIEQDVLQEVIHDEIRVEISKHKLYLEFVNLLMNLYYNRLVGGIEDARDKIWSNFYYIWST